MYWCDNSRMYWCLFECTGAYLSFPSMKLLFLLWALLVAASHRDISSTQEILEKPYTFIYFHADDCQFCQAFNPDFEYLASLYNASKNLQMVRIDGRKHKDLVQLFGVTSFPTLKLYDAKEKQIISYNNPRLKENIRRFIEEHSDAVATETNLEQNVQVVESLADIDTSSKPVLLAFVSRRSLDWKDYFYPNHFYQRVAREFPQVDFKLVFYESAGPEVMQKYHVSNIPSLVFLDTNYIKVFNSYSTNQLVNHVISEDALRHFMLHVREEEQGKSFATEADLGAFVAAMDFEGHMQRKGGMNVIDSRTRGDMTLEEEYSALLESIGL